MRIIVIGSQGMLGQELATVLHKDQPLLMDRQELDITDEKQVKAVVKQVKPDVVINAAAYNDVDGAEKNADLAYAINESGPGYLARALHASGGILVHYSTDYVFKGNKKDGYAEHERPHPQSVYARSKYLGEVKIQKNMKRYYIIRLSRLFGRPGSSEAAKKSFVQLMLDLAKSKPELTVVNEELNCPTYAPDLAWQTKYLIEKKQSFGVYHVTNAGSCTWYDFAREIFTITHINVKLNPVPASFFPRPAMRPHYSILLNTKLPAMRRWQEALKEFLTTNV